MKTIIVNGIEHQVEHDNIPLDSLLQQINKDLSSSRQVVSNIRINGEELTEEMQGVLSSTDVGSLGAIEVFTSNPAELANETLTTLEIFLERLLGYISASANAYKTKNLIAGDDYFLKTIDGLDLFVQTINGVKLALRISLQPKIALAEATLVSIMGDLLEAKKQTNLFVIAELMENDLTQNLIEWRDDVFPILKNWKSS